MSDLQKPEIINSSKSNIFVTVQIVAEIVAILGIAVYFYKQTNILTSKLEQLNSKLSELEELVENHEKVLQKISNRLFTPKVATATAVATVVKPQVSIIEEVPIDEEIADEIKELI